MGELEQYQKEVEELQLELLHELQEELSDGILNEGSKIQVIEENGIIIDWYYIDAVMRKDMENYYDEDEIEVKKELWEQYQENKPYLEEWIVRDVIFFIEKFMMGNPTIKGLRQELGLEQQDISNMFLIPVKTIQNWEQGRRQIPIYVERLILKELWKLNIERHKNTIK